MTTVSKIAFVTTVSKTVSVTTIPKRVFEIIDSVIEDREFPKGQCLNNTRRELL